MFGSLRRFASLWQESGQSSRLQGARRHAQSSLPDTDACAALAAEIADIPRDALTSEITQWWPRGEYLSDRAFRLLVGVRDGGEVPPIEPATRDQFARDEEFGRIPLPEAFRRLAASDPALERLEQLARTAHKLPKDMLQDLRPILQSTKDAHGDIAARVILRYLRDCAQGNDDPTPLFHRLDGSGRHGTIGLGRTG